MHHFFLPPNSFNANAVVFPREIAHQIIKVLRLPEGAQVLALDGSGCEFLTRLRFTGSQLVGEVMERRENNAEPGLRLTLAVAMTQREKFEWVLQKGTELGVGAFLPFASKYSLNQETELETGKRLRREKIIREAAEQCERGRLPVLHSPLPFSRCLEVAVKGGRIFFGAERGGATSLLTASQGLDPIAAVTWVVGPEGGFSQEETSQAAQSGAELVSLGARILRMETAAIAGAAIILAAAGDLGLSGS